MSIVWNDHALRRIGHTAESADELVQLASNRRSDEALAGWSEALADATRDHAARTATTEPAPKIFYTSSEIKRLTATARKLGYVR